MPEKEKISAIGADTSFGLFNKTGGVKAPASAQPKLANPPAVKTTGGSGGGFSMSGLNDMMGSMNIGAKGGDMLASIGSAIGAEKYGDFSEDEKATQSAIRQGLAMIPGYGQIIAAATGAVDAIGSATGLNLSSVNKETASRAGVSGTGFNKMMNMLPGNSMIWGSLSALAGYDRTKSINISDKVNDIAGGYSGSMMDLDAAKDLGNKRLFFGQTDQANAYITEQQKKADLLAQISKTNTQRKQSDYFQDLQNQNINRYAGQNYLSNVVGRNGMKLMSVAEARQIIALRKATEVEDVEKLQNGGTIGIDTNILPEGSLHKERHHLEDTNPDLEDVTKKGIPVVAAEGGEISDQIAEIERDELILRLEVTKQIEELMKDGSEEAMIEAGKILTAEIIENTQDNTGQITEENGKE